MSQTNTPANTAAGTTTSSNVSEPPLFSLANAVKSPGSTWSGVASILTVLSTAMAGGLPTTSAGWITFAVAILTGLASVFSKAGGNS